MSKISDLPQLNDNDLDGLETVPVVKAAATYRARLGAMASAAVGGIARASLNALSTADAGWAPGTRINSANGNADALAGFESTPFIPVKAGVTYVTNLTGFGAFYDEDKIYVQSASVEPIWSKPFLTAPADGFIRMSAQTNGGYARAQMYFQEGSAYPDFVEPFGSILRVDRLFRASGQGFVDDALSPRQISAWKESANKANPNGRVDGFFMATNGAPSAHGTYSYWPPIPVSPGETWTANQSMRFVTFLDAGGRANSSLGIEAATTQFTVPVGARFAIPTSNTSAAATFALERRPDAPTFSPYGWEARSLLPNGEPVSWGVPSGPQLVAAIDQQLASVDWRAGASTPASYGLERLRETRQRLRSLRGGKAGLDARLTISLGPGDSYTHDAGRWSRNVARSLWGKYNPEETNKGPIGGGWHSFRGLGSGAGSNLPNGVVWSNSVFVGSGAWASENASAYGPDTGSTTGSAPGDYIQHAGAFVFDYDLGFDYDLFFDGGAGVVRYRWTDAGAWQTLDLSGFAAGVQVEAMTGVPGGGTGRFRIEVVSGSPRLFGLNERHPTSAGILVHKIAATGSSMQDWAAVDHAQWKIGFAALAPDLGIVMHGPNDQGDNRTKAQFKADTLEQIDAMREARPTMDILLVAPPENQLGRAVPISDYAAAMFEIARDLRDVAFLNLQPVFGVLPADYAFGSARPWFANDDTHPEPATGGWAMTDAILAAIGEQAA